MAQSAMVEAKCIFRDCADKLWNKGSSISKQEVYITALQEIESNIDICKGRWTKRVEFWNSVKEALIKKYGN